MDKDNPSIADEMNRELYLDPDLIGEYEDDVLLDQAEDNVEETVEEAAERQERESEESKDRP